MKNSQKWLIIFIALLPFVTILTAFYIVDVSIKDLPVWLAVLLLVSMLTPAPAFILAQRKAHKIPLKKRRKRKQRVLISLGWFIAFTLFNLMMPSALLGISIWRDMFSNIGFLVLVFLVIFAHIFVFFLKEKEQEPTDSSMKENC